MRCEPSVWLAYQAVLIMRFDSCVQHFYFLLWNKCIQKALLSTHSRADPTNIRNIWSCKSVWVLNYTQTPPWSHWVLHQIPLGNVGTFLTQHYSIIPTMCGVSFQSSVLPAWAMENHTEDRQLLVISTIFYCNWVRIEKVDHIEHQHSSPFLKVIEIVYTSVCLAMWPRST